MSLIKSNTDIKEIKNVINKNVASSFRTQPSFVELLKLNGCPALKVGVIGSEIRQQLIMEAENGELTLDSVMPRAYTLKSKISELMMIWTIIKLFQSVRRDLMQCFLIRLQVFSMDLQVKTPWEGQAIFQPLLEKAGLNGNPARYYLKRTA